MTATAYDTAGLTSSDTRSLAVDNTSPTIAVTSPGAGNVAGTVTLVADSSDPAPGSGVASVQFFVDGTAVGTDTTAPYQATWNSTTTEQRPAHHHRACHRRSWERGDVGRGRREREQRGTGRRRSPSPG